MTTELIVNPDDLSALKTAKPVGIDMNIQYWSPEDVGEQKTVMLLGYLVRQFDDQNKPGERRDVPCAVFVDADGHVYENGSAILVSCLKTHFQQGDKMLIEFIGTKKSQKGNTCSNWRVVRLQEAS